MRIPSAKVDQYIYFVAVDATDFTTRKTALATWTVQRSRKGAAEVAYTTPTITEIDATTMPGVYALLVDEDTTIDSGSDSEEYCVHITHAGMAPVTRTIELYRRTATAGNQLLVDANGRADVIKIAGTTQTARDIGASVLLSTGTGTGQLDFTSGVVKANATQWLGGAIPAVNVTGVPLVDVKYLLGTIFATPATAGIPDVNVKNAANTAWGSGAITAASIAASALNGKGDWNIGKTGYALSAAGVQAIWDALTSALTTAGSIGKLLVDNINATISSRSSHAAADIWAVATRLLTAGTNIVLAKGVGVTGFNDLDAAGVRAAVGLASANLDTQLDALPTNTDLATALGTADDAVLAQVALVKAKTDLIPAAPAAVGDVPTANQNADALLDRAAGIETGLTPRQGLRLMSAALLGKASGMDTDTATFRDVNNTTNRIVAAVDEFGNRTSVTLNPS